MKTHRLFSTVIAMVFGVVILGSAAFAQGGRGGRQAAQKLNLTQEQRDKLKQERQQFEAQHAQDLADVKALRQKLQEYIKNNDKANAQATREQIKAKMAPLQQEMQNERNAVLTPEQQAQIEQMKANRKEKMQERRKNRKQS
jgi:Spy/CpxP family protein refolding chaperone